jgi:hypothetical protein
MGPGHLTVRRAGALAFVTLARPGVRPVVPAGEGATLRGAAGWTQ